MKTKQILIVLVTFLVIGNEAMAQIEERIRPAGWENLVQGGRFMDLFLPMKSVGKLTSDTWGAEGVIPRYIDNGIENRKWSYWGGNIKKCEDGKYHLFVCGWLESSPRGHATWPGSTVFNAVSDNPYGPFVVIDTVGKGHNPEVYRLKDGRYVLYVIDGYYIADGCNGPWTYKKFEFLNRDRHIIEGLSNLTFAQREDGSYMMVCRGGGVWFSQTGISAYNQISEKRVYPDIRGRFEDPVIWRDNVQYNLIVNDWLGRAAYYLRSKDGRNWKWESGEAYLPGVSVLEDGKIEEWFKYERIKIYQDQYGRAIQANFAVIDTLKNEDKANDNHSSKNICIPLTTGRLLTILDKKPITEKTKTIRVKIASEEGFDPQSDIDINSLRFGEAETVNYGKGCGVLKTEKSGKDLIVTFNGEGNGIPEDEFTAKMLGKTNKGKLLFGYARLPYVNFIEPILSACLPKITSSDNGFKLSVEVQNFGQVASKSTKMKIVYTTADKKEVVVATGKVKGLKPYEKTNIELTCGNVLVKGAEYNMIVIIHPDDKNPSLLHGKIKI
jgi:hypothetical protein